MQYNEINKLTILIDKVTHTLHHVIKLAVSEQKLKHRYFSPLSSQYENVGHWAMLVQNIPLIPLASPRKKIRYRKKCLCRACFDRSLDRSAKTLKFDPLMGIFKFSDPPYMGQNNFVGSNEHTPWVLCIKLHLKMPGDVNFSPFLVKLPILVPPLPVRRENAKWKSEQIQSLYHEKS